MRPRTQAYLDLAGGFALAGSSVVVGKIIASSLPIYAATAAGLAAALLVLIPLALGEGWPTAGVLVRSLPLLGLQAFFGIFLFRILLLNGLKASGAAEVGVICAAAPAMTAVLSALLLGERIGPRAAVGIALTVAGLAVVAGQGLDGTAAAGARLLGDALALGAILSGSTFSVLSKKLGNALRPRTTSAAVTAIALVLYLPLGAATGEIALLVTIRPLEWAAIAYYGVFVTAVAYILWYRGVARVPASTAGVFAGFMPLSSTILSFLVLGERPGVGLLGGCALTLVGIILASTAPAARESPGDRGAKRTGRWWWPRREPSP